jgi:hypothetical protein
MPVAITCVLFYEKSNPTFSLSFLFIKYSKTTYQKHHLHIKGKRHGLNKLA